MEHRRSLFCPFQPRLLKLERARFVVAGWRAACMRHSVESCCSLPHFSFFIPSSPPLHSLPLPLLPSLVESALRLARILPPASPELLPLSCLANMPAWARSVTCRLYPHPVHEAVSKDAMPCSFMCREQVQRFDSFTKVGLTTAGMANRSALKG